MWTPRRTDHPSPLPPGVPGSPLGTADTTATVSAPTASAPPPLDQPPDHPHEFTGLEGLGEEGVDPDLKPALDLVPGTGTDDGERKLTGTGIGTQPGRGPEPVQPRHGDIEGDEVGPHLMDDFQTLGTIGRGHDLDALKLEIDPDQLPDDLVVVHNKDPARRPWHNSRVGRDRPPRPRFPDFHPKDAPAGTQGDALRETGSSPPLQNWYCSTRRSDHRNRHAPVAQGIEQRPPEPCAQVRILPGAPCMRCPKTPPSALSLRTGSSRMCRRVPPGAALCRGLRTRRGRDLGASPQVTGAFGGRSADARCNGAPADPVSPAATPSHGSRLLRSAA